MHVVDAGCSAASLECRRPALDPRTRLLGSTPGKTMGNQAWLSVVANGSVTLYRRDGEREEGGQWHGCMGRGLAAF